MGEGNFKLSTFVIHLPWPFRAKEGKDERLSFEIARTLLRCAWYSRSAGGGAQRLRRPARIT